MLARSTHSADGLHSGCAFTGAPPWGSPDPSGTVPPPRPRPPPSRTLPRVPGRSARGDADEQPAADEALGVPARVQPHGEERGGVLVVGEQAQLVALVGAHHLAVGG